MKRNNTSVYENMLAKGDLRTIGQSDEIVAQIQSQSDFNSLLSLVSHHKRRIAMRAMDAVEKISRKHQEYVTPHHQLLVDLCETAVDKEMLWHLALIIPRLSLKREEVERLWHLFSVWVADKAQSRIVRVNSLQALFDLRLVAKKRSSEFSELLFQLELENIPSLRAKIRKLRKAMVGKSIH